MENINIETLIENFHYKLDLEIKAMQIHKLNILNDIANSNDNWEAEAENIEIAGGDENNNDY